MILIAQTRTMSLAVNELVTASHAVFGSLSLQRDDMIQARDRLNRIGQTRPVTFWYALAPGNGRRDHYGQPAGPDGSRSRDDPAYRRRRAAS
jgi:hypothetical protein